MVQSPRPFWSKRLPVADVQMLHRLAQARTVPVVTKKKAAKKKQGGYFDISFLDVLFFLVVVALIGGFFFYRVLPWLWTLIKPLIHAATS